MRKSDVTQESLRNLLEYSSITGRFTWKVKASTRETIGSNAGSDRNGYRRIVINKSCYMAHRLAWLYVHGEWPNGEIDHVNRIRNDNRIDNLRIATRSQNQSNIGVLSNNKCGFRGVSWHKASKAWRATIRLDDKEEHLGIFPAPELAAIARNARAKELFGEFAISSFSGSQRRVQTIDGKYIAPQASHRGSTTQAEKPKT